MLIIVQDHLLLQELAALCYIIRTVLANVSSQDFEILKFILYKEAFHMYAGPLTIFGLPFLLILELFVNVSGKSDCETYYVCLLLKRYHSDKSSDNHGQDDTLLPQYALFLSDS